MKFLFFEDGDGRNYTIDEFRGRDVWSFHVSTQGFPRVAYVNCLLGTDRELQLADIKVEDCVNAPPHKWPISLFLPRQRKSFRGIGLGTALLDRVLQAAKREGFRMVTGRIFPKDLKEQPWLPHWYAQFGFSNRPDGDGIAISRTCR